MWSGMTPADEILGLEGSRADPMQNDFANNLSDDGTMKDALTRGRGGERIQITLGQGSAAPELVKTTVEKDSRVARVLMNVEKPDVLMVEMAPGEHSTSR